MKKIFFLSIVVTMFLFCPNRKANAQGGVSINAAGSVPDPSAMLDVNSTIKGELMPRMTTAQRNAISNPATGLFIYNTDCNVVNFNAGTPQNPNWATLNSSNALMAGVSIVANPVGAICAGTSVTFTATPSQNNLSPSYQWQVNGSNVGNNSTTYTASNFNNGDVVSCILTSGVPCITGSPATSNAITMSINPGGSNPGAVSGPSTVCANATGNVYSISPVSGATSYNWTVPGGASITAGASTTSITVSFGATSGNVGVAAVNACGASSVINDSVTVNAAPATPGSVSGNATFTTNQTGVSYSISAVNGATTYTWTVPSDATITAGQGTTSITVSFATNSGNVCVSAGNTCGTSGTSCMAVTNSNCGGAGSQTFSYTGGQQTFSVPCGINSVTINCYGAQGATTSTTYLGGLGGLATGTLAVTPGEILYVYVGGQTGWNGGGIGGTGGGANGGDESDVRVGGTSINNWVIVAGGGGAGSYDGGGAGGAGGGGEGCANGAGGAGGTSEATQYGAPGSPGTCTNGGAAGSSYGGWTGGGGGGGLTSGGGGSGGGGYANSGTAGTQGQGGTRGGNLNGYCVNGSGCGGGGGYYGGGGTSDGQCAAGSGGGGSSWASASMSNTSFSGGVQSGNGQVVITW